jgi:ATP-dependent Clp protease ATP-binding subunit ClpA
MLQRAGTESRGIRHSYIGCEHLLLAFLSDDSSAAAGLLARHGVNLANARAAVLHVMGAPPEKS